MLSDSSDEEYTTKDLFNPIEEVSVLADTSYQERDQKLDSNLDELSNLFDDINNWTFESNPTTVNTSVNQTFNTTKIIEQINNLTQYHTLNKENIMSDLVKYEDYKNKYNELLTNKLSYNKLQKAKANTMASICNKCFVAGNEIFMAFLKITEDATNNGSNVVTLDSLKEQCIKFQDILTERTSIKTLGDYIATGKSEVATTEEDLDKKRQELVDENNRLEENKTELEKKISEAKQDFEEFKQTETTALDMEKERLKELEYELKEKETKLTAEKTTVAKAKKVNEEKEKELNEKESASISQLTAATKLLQNAHKKEEELKRKQKEFEEKQKAKKDESSNDEEESQSEDDSTSENKRIPKNSNGFKLDKKALALFFGRKEEIVENWLLITNNTLEMANIPTKNRISCVLPVLREAALDYTIAYLAKNGYNDWTKYSDGLKLAFEPIDLQQTLSTNLLFTTIY